MKYKLLILFLIVFSVQQFPLANPKTQKNIMELQKKINNTSGKNKVDILNKTAFECHSQNPKKCIKYSTQALKLATLLRYENGKAESLKLIGLGYHLSGDLKKSLTYYKRSLKIFKNLQIKKKIASCHRLIGDILGLVGKNEQALSNYLEAGRLYEEIGDKSELANFYISIGTIYWRSNYFEKALDYHFKSLKASRETGKKKIEALCLTNIGFYYFSKKNFKEALKYYKKALNVHQDIGNKFSSSFLTNMGTIYQILGDNRKALKFMFKSLEKAKGTGKKCEIASSLHGIGIIYGSIKGSNKALKYLNKALDISVNNNFKNISRGIYLSLFEYLKSKGNYKESLKYHELYSDLKNKILSEKNNKRIAEMEVKYRTLQKEKENAILVADKKLLEKSNKIQEISLSKSTITRNFFIIGFIMVLLILILLFKKYLYLFAFWKKEKYISQYRLQEKIGSGGICTVFKAHSVRNKTDIVAIKVLREEIAEYPNIKKRFKQEATIINKLNHPNIIKIFEMGEFKDKLYLVMELLEGRTLDQMIIDRKNINFKICFQIMKQIAESINYIHTKNIIHRDLKPANIMLIEKDNNPNFVKLLDFGIAKKKFQTTLTKDGELIGTIGYISPEQLLNENITFASDIYSLGIIYYELITGVKAFPYEDGFRILKKILEENPVDPIKLQPKISIDMNNLIKSMILKNPEERPSASEILNIIQDL